MAKKKGSKGAVEKKPVARNNDDVNIDALTQHSDDDYDQFQHQEDMEEAVEIGKLADSDDDTSVPQGASRWEKIQQQEFAEIDRKSKSWGKNKDAYYNSDTQYFDVDFNQEEADMEEEQVRAIQRKQAGDLAGEDFGLGDLLNRRKGKKATGENQSTLNSLNKLDLTQDEKIKQVIMDTPELLGMLDEYASRMKELRTDVIPLLDRLKSGDIELATEDGISFLQLRYQLLVAYCVHIAFYLLLKAEGQSVQTHPVIKRLVHIRIVLEKMKPVMAQLQYQVEKLLSSVQVHKSASDKESVLMAYKPNLASFGKTEEQVSKEQSSKKKKAQEEEEAIKSSKSGKSGKKVVNTTDYEIAERLQNELHEKKLDQQYSRAELSLAQELRDELLERPEVMGTIGSNNKRVRMLEADREDFEEEHYTRLQESRERKKMRMRAERTEGFDDVDDLGSINSLLNFEKKQRKLEGERRHLHQLQSNLDNQQSMEDSLDFDFDDDDVETYNSAVASGKATKQAKKSVRNVGKQERKIFEQQDDDDAGMIDGDERRGAGMKILKNKGLMRARSKHGHARVANRAKHDKAMVKHRAQHKEYNGKRDTDYSGESTGINRHVIKAHILKK